MKYNKLKLGLDLGTNSVGWALLNENNQLVKKNGFTFWGVRMFDEAHTANDRRGYRNSRRRLNRRKERINLLRDIFRDEINKVDSTFFKRLDDSFFIKDDKENNNHYIFFDDEYNDNNYFDEYPTIYHLRYHLIKSEEKEDIRKIFLAISNIVKFRGNFLVAGEEFNKSNSKEIKNIFEEINDNIRELSISFENDDEGYDSSYFSKIDFEKDDFFLNLENILCEKIGVSTKQVKLLELFNVGKRTFVNEFIIKLLSGAKCDLSKLQCVKGNGYDKTEIILESEDLELKLDEAKSNIPELSIILSQVLNLKAISDHYYVLKVMGRADNYSEAMVNLYDEHQMDLVRLKKFVKTYNKDKYNECFRKIDEKLNNYALYVGRNDANGKMKRCKHTSQINFYDYLKKNILNVKVDEHGQKEKEYFESKMANQELLRRQNSNSNGSFPMQLHLAELKKILANQSKYYPFLLEKSDGLTNIEKIIAIFKYKLPYYVGPLNNNSKYSWVIRTNDKITPWNFNQVVDLDSTAEKFIRRMQNKCTYLKGDTDYCLPIYSLLFSEYNCLSYLNKLQINGNLINDELKKRIFEDVFLQKKKPVKKDIFNYIVSNYGKDSIIGGEKGLPELNANMSSYITFKEIFKDEFETNKDLIENIIKDITLFEDKSILEKRLKEKYGLSSEKIKPIKSLNYKGYSRISEKLLNQLEISNPNTGEYYGTLINIMRNTNLNLQEVLYHPNYRLIDIVDKYNSELLSKDDLTLDEFITENISVSPSIKRAIIQAMKIIDEIEKIFNHKIDEYYIECTRTNKDKKKATLSRYENIVNLYKNINDTIFDINIKNLKEQLEDNKDNLKSDLFYLYFTQLGKCMYTLEDININDLLNNNCYDIDHIYPQAVIKDDSLSNRVLVKKGVNNRKQDKFLFETDIKSPKANQFYSMLLDKKLITAEKYRRLTINQLNEKELDGFVNRQITITNQSVKGLVECLKLYKNVGNENIIYSKGENISDFRNRFDLVKSRLANNFHHAHDAYLNVIVGGVIHEYFTRNRYSNVFKDYQRMKAEGITINFSKIFDKEELFVKKVKIWDKKEMLEQIKNDLYKRFDVKETFRSYSPNDMFSQVSIVPAGSGKIIPVKTTDARSNTNKYGGIKQQSYTRYVIVKTKDKKGKDCVILEAIPRTAIKSKTDENINKKSIDDYLSTIYSEFLVENYNIKSNVVIKDESKRFVITGKTNDSYYIQNINDRFFNFSSIVTIKKIEKYMDQLKKDVKMPLVGDDIVISVAKNDKCKEIRLTKQELLSLFECIKEMYNKKIYAFSSILKLVENIIKKDEKVKSMNIIELVNVIFEELKLLKTNERSSADLTSIGLAKSFGIFTISKTLTGGMKFIHESVTGYYQKVLYEVK